MVQGMVDARTGRLLYLYERETKNDGHGHLAGAEAVRTVGHIIAARLPQDAVAAREIADDLRAAVHGSAPVLAGVSFPAGTLSISACIACRVIEWRPQASVAEDDAAGESLFRAADEALYAAKGRGRNRVVVAEPAEREGRCGSPRTMNEQHPEHIPRKTKTALKKQGLGQHLGPREHARITGFRRRASRTA